MTNAIRPYLDFVTRTGEARKEREFRASLLESQMDAKRNATRTAMIAQATNEAIETAMEPILEKSRFEFRQTLRDKARAKQLAEAESIVDQRDDLTLEQKGAIKGQLLMQRMGLQGRLMTRDEPWPVGQEPGKVFQLQNGMWAYRKMDGDLEFLTPKQRGMDRMMDKMLQLAMENALSERYNEETEQYETYVDGEKFQQLYLSGMRILQGDVDPQNKLQPPPPDGQNKDTIQTQKQPEEQPEQEPDSILDKVIGGAKRGAVGYGRMMDTEIKRMGTLAEQGQLGKAAADIGKGIGPAVNQKVGKTILDQAAKHVAGQGIGRAVNQKVGKTILDQAAKHVAGQGIGRAVNQKVGKTILDQAAKHVAGQARKERRREQAKQIDQEIRMMPVDQFQEAVKSAEVYSGEADPVPGQYYKSGSGKLFIANEDGTLIPVQPGTAP